MIAAGSALFLLPVALDLGGAAILTGFLVGAIATTLGIAGTATDGRGTLPLSAHAAYDRGLAVGLLVVAIMFGVADQPAALALFGAAGLVQLALGSSRATPPAARSRRYRTSSNRSHIASLLPRKRPAKAGRFLFRQGRRARSSTASATRAATASGVSPTSSRSSAGAPWVT